ncbi:MAG: hypothetical protein JSS32_03235 [Verrucomicrobia bacterium]|nr:hypothetical protein [Verrucomicrobiota bacterium]
MPSISEFQPGSWATVQTDLVGRNNKPVIHNPVFVLSQEKSGSRNITILLDQNLQQITFDTGARKGSLRTGAAYGFVDLKLSFIHYTKKLKGTHSFSPKEPEPIIEEAKKVRAVFLEKNPKLRGNFFRLPDDPPLQSKI